MSVLTTSERREDLAPGISGSPGNPDGSGPRDRSRVRRLLAGLLVIVVVASAAVLVWLATGGRSSAQGTDLPAEREQVMSLTSQFVKRLGTYSPDMLDEAGRMPDYRDQVREVITPKFAADFDQEVTTAEQLVAQGGITRSADVFATAVSAIDDDSARVLVAGAFTDSYTQAAGTKGGNDTGKQDRTVDQEPLPFRFTVDLVLVGGEWLVDDFAPVASPGGPGQGATEGSAP
ncbi:hypothetical protein [Nocardioides hwasunensis]|uniref:Mce-associated membrane protein n=1 Tax=Nocardioides hwasunensis TaxID=397258 RepID=A0ABR8MD43_9ACTN|nr:hypothetical protein [Nocardioides hwasunensis]MBD3913877.1 hypothetical protein [Nocardioides hwasunensis]